jgi:hypothetical protein
MSQAAAAEHGSGEQYHLLLYQRDRLNSVAGWLLQWPMWSPIRGYCPEKQLPEQF